MKLSRNLRVGDTLRRIFPKCNRFFSKKQRMSILLLKRYNTGWTATQLAIIKAQLACITREVNNIYLKFN